MLNSPPRDEEEDLNAEKIWLNNCSRLQSLQNLPLGLLEVRARGCASLETWSNQLALTSAETGFTVVDCRRDVHQFRRIWPLNSGGHPFLKRHLEVCLSHTLSHWTSLYILMSFDILQVSIRQNFETLILQLSAVEIPKWFSHQSPGLFVTIPLPVDLCDNSSWRGIVLSGLFDWDDTSPEKNFSLSFGIVRSDMV